MGMPHLSMRTYLGAKGTLPVNSCNACLAAGLLPRLPEKPLCSQCLRKQGFGKTAIRCLLEIDFDQEKGHRCSHLLVNHLQDSVQLHAAHPNGVVSHTCTLCPIGPIQAAFKAGAGSFGIDWCSAGIQPHLV